MRLNPTADGLGTATQPATLARFRQRVFRIRAEDALPLLVEHRRIYILPTRRGWAFLGALFIMLIASVNYALSLGYALCFLLTGLYSATLLSTYRNLAGMAVRRIDTSVTFAGGSLSFVTTLENPTRLARYGLRLATRKTGTRPLASVTSDVAAESEQKAELLLPTTLRGRQSLGRLTLECDWPLGLWNAWSYLHADVQGIVYPTPEADAPMVPAEPSTPESGSPHRTRRGDVAGLRPYLPGDEPGTIAWKSLARGQGLHVRLFEADSGRGLTTLTLASTRLIDTEAQLSRLTAWVLAAEAGDNEYSLDLPAVRLASTRGPVQREAALTALALHGDLRTAS